MFIGEYQYSIDDKNRLALPARFRARLAKGSVVTRGLDNCLFVYTREEWQKLSVKLAALPISQAKSRAFARLMLAGAMEIVLDKMGRFVVPDYLKQFAGLGKNVVIAGLYDRLEIWDAKIWDQYKQKTEKESNDIAETLGELGV